MGADRVREGGKVVLERGRGRVGGQWLVSGVDRRIESLVDVRDMLDHMVCY